MNGTAVTSPSKTVPSRRSNRSSRKGTAFFSSATTGALDHRRTGVRVDYFQEASADNLAGAFRAETWRGGRIEIPKDSIGLDVHPHGCALDRRRNRSSLSRSACSACLRSVMSSAIPSKTKRRGGFLNPPAESRYARSFIFAPVSGVYPA